MTRLERYTECFHPPSSQSVKYSVKLYKMRSNTPSNGSAKYEDPVVKSAFECS